MLHIEQVTCVIEVDPFICTLDVSDHKKWIFGSEVLLVRDGFILTSVIQSQ